MGEKEVSVASVAAEFDDASADVNFRLACERILELRKEKDR